MGKDVPGWYYVGNSQKRYMDADGWTDQYKAFEDPFKTIDKPRARIRPSRAYTEPADPVSPSAAPANKPPDVNQPRRRTSTLLIALCVGLLVLGVGGGLKANVFSGWAAWATEQAGQISAFISPPPPTPHAVVSKPKAKAKTNAPKAVAP